MKGFKKWITSPITTIVLFVAAGGLLLFSTIGAARALPQYISETYSGHVDMLDIGVSLLEKSAHDDKAKIVAFRDYKDTTEGDNWDETNTPTKVGPLLGNLLAKGEEFVPGKTYTEEISVQNTGTINEWVRVTLYKYWLDPEGNKVIPFDKNLKEEMLPTGMVMAPETSVINSYSLSPALIHFTYDNVVDGNGNGDWIHDEEASIPEEREVYYYNKLLTKDATTTPLTKSLSVHKSIADTVVQTPEDDGKTVVTTFVYDGWQFCVEASVDAVQERNAVDAIKSAWGRDVSFDNGTMVLK